MIKGLVAATKSVLCASPAYIERCGEPTSPAELGRARPTHNCLRLARRHKLLDLWKFEKDGLTEDVKVTGSLSSASGDALQEWAFVR
jgi:LysR family transcriptional regulator, transcriptional activator for dmlA